MRLETTVTGNIVMKSWTCGVCQGSSPVLNEAREADTREHNRPKAFVRPGRRTR